MLRISTDSGSFSVKGAVRQRIGNRIEFISTLHIALGERTLT